MPHCEDGIWTDLREVRQEIILISWARTFKAEKNSGTDVLKQEFA